MKLRRTIAFSFDDTKGYDFYIGQSLEAQICWFKAGSKRVKEHGIDPGWHVDVRNPETQYLERTGDPYPTYRAAWEALKAKLRENFGAVVSDELQEASC